GNRPGCHRRRHAGRRHRHHGPHGEVRHMNHFTADKFQIERWLPNGVTVADLISLLAALATLMAFLAIWNALRSTSAYDRRFAQIAQRKESLRRAMMSSRRERPRLTPVGLMSEAVKRLNL